MAIKLLKTFSGSSISPTQIKHWKQCRRSWVLHYICGYKMPQTTAQLMGSEVHETLARYLRTGNALPETKAGLTARAGLLYLPKPGGHLIVETKYYIEVEADLVFQGTIDLLDVEDCKVYDHKTTSNFRYLPDIDELQKDEQVLMYGTIAQCLIQRPELRWIYYLTKGAPDSRMRHIDADELDKALQQNWQNLLVTAREVKNAWVTRPNPLDVICNERHCSAYSGCPYMPLCASLTRREEGTMNAIQERIAQLKAKAAAQGGAPLSPVATSDGVHPPIDPNVPPPPAGKPPRQPGRPPMKVNMSVPVKQALPEINPPEVPSAPTPAPVCPICWKNEVWTGSIWRCIDSHEELAGSGEAVPAESAVPVEAPVQRRGRPPKAETLKAETLKAETLKAETLKAETLKAETLKAETLKAEAPKGQLELIVYQDCFPVFPVEPELQHFSQWIQPAAEEVAKVNGVGHYRLMDFAKWEAPLALLVDAQLKAAKGRIAVYVESYSAPKAALEQLICHATQVIRGV